MEKGKANESVIFGGGCFWCIEAVFSRVKGVEAVVSGYAGGNKKDPTYKDVSSGSTGHAEVTKVTFNPKIISLENILHIFFTVHDPTSKNRQGNDIGSQYRSIILYIDELQKQEAKKVMREISTSNIYTDPLVTELAPLDIFYPAEEYHQRYFEKNLGQAYCQIVIAPKIVKFRKKYAHFYKS